MKSTPSDSIQTALATRSSAARLSPITLMSYFFPASTTFRIVASCARPITTTRSAPAHAPGQQQRRTRFEPVHAGLDGNGGGVERFVERYQVERELNDGERQVI